MKKVIFILSGLIILAVSSCGPKPGTPEAALKIKKDQIEKVEKKVEETVDNIPKWCLNPPASDFALAACGTGESASMNMARNRAILDAKRQLADSIDSEISSRMEDFLKSTGMGSNEQVKQASEIVTKNTTIQAKLIGYKQTKTDAISMGGKYQFFIGFSRFFINSPFSNLIVILIKKSSKNRSKIHQNPSKMPFEI